MEISGHDKTGEELQRRFEVDENGLSDRQVEDNRKKYGKNGKAAVNKIIKIHSAGSACVCDG